ncbi:MAG: hypothetical protein M3O28_06935 [Actinomycetota bacterium]|nr:hypothetical protein [Actinomycetota bacterium]
MSDAAQHLPLPLACTLGPADGPDRLRRWRLLTKTGNAVAYREGDRLQVRFALGEAAFGELTILAAAERECCAFVQWTVIREGTYAVLQVTADPESPDDVAPIAAMFDAVPQAT